MASITVPQTAPAAATAWRWLHRLDRVRRRGRDLAITAIARLHSRGFQPAHLTTLLGLLA